MVNKSGFALLSDPRISKRSLREKLLWIAVQLSSITVMCGVFSSFWNILHSPDGRKSSADNTEFCTNGKNNRFPNCMPPITQLFRRLIPITQPLSRLSPITRLFSVANDCVTFPAFAIGCPTFHAFANHYPTFSRVAAGRAPATGYPTFPTFPVLNISFFPDLYTSAISP